MIRHTVLFAFAISLSAAAAHAQISADPSGKIPANPPQGRLIIAGADATAPDQLAYAITYAADDAMVGGKLQIEVKDTCRVEETVANPKTGKMEKRGKDQVRKAFIPFAPKKDGTRVLTLPQPQAQNSTFELAVVTGGQSPQPLSNTIKLFPRGGRRVLAEAGDVGKMTAACPEKPTVQPSKPRKVLVYTKTLGFPHSSVPIGARAIQIMGQKATAWQTVISDDAYMFEPQTLAQFDAVMMMSTTGELFGVADRASNERLRKSLLDFVSSGKGIAGSHAATDCSYRWKEYGDMFGGYFAGHPFGSIHVKIDDPSSPINAVFASQDFDIRDEIYTFREPYSRKSQRILLSIDMAKTRLADDPKRPGFKQGENRNDHDYALSWIKPYGQGRVFYCAFGHDHGIFWNKAILQHYLDGMQYALGDLKAADEPSEK